MTKTDLQEHIYQEFSMLDATMKLLSEIPQMSSVRSLNVYEKAGIAHLISNIYNGVEHILRRICRYVNVPIPEGATSHIALFELFTTRTNHKHLPVLIPEHLERDMMRLRKFRHRVIHGYGFTFEEEPIQAALEHLPEVYQTFRKEVEKFLETLNR